MTVLLVEDDPAIRASLVEFLEQIGLEILEAGDAKDALAILADPAHRITVLVTDLNLGPGDDGLVLAAKARLSLPDLLVVYATGCSERLAGRQVSPWETIFLKPFDPTLLAAAVLALARSTLPRRGGYVPLLEGVAASSR